MSKSKTMELAIKIAGEVDKSLGNSAKSATKELSGIQKAASTMTKAAAAGAAAVGAAALTAAKGLAELGSTWQKATNQIAMSTGATGHELEELRDTMEEVYKAGFGENASDVANAVAQVNRNLKGLSQDGLETATKGAMSLENAFNYSVEESTRAAAAIRKNFGTSAEEAFSLIAAGAQNGLDYSGELIDTINEYSSQFAKLGFDADGMFNLLQSGADSTAWNLDKVGDAIKEFSIRAIDGSDTTVEAFTSLGYNAEEIMATFAAGGEEANSAFFDVINTLMKVDNQVNRDALGVALFGTMWEDLGVEAMQAMASASTAAYDTGHALEQINSVQYNDLGSALELIKRQLEMAILPAADMVYQTIMGYMPQIQEAANKFGTYLTETLIPAAQSAADWIGAHSDLIIGLAAGILTVVAAYKVAQGVVAIYNTVMAASKVVTAVMAKMHGVQTGELAAQTAATTAAIGPTTGLAVATNGLCWPLLLIVAIIAAVVVAIVLLIKNWDKVKATAITVWNTIVSVWSKAAAWFKEKVITPIVNFFKPIVETIVGFFKGCWILIQAIWKAVSTWFNEHVITPIINFFRPIIEKVSGFFSTLWGKIVEIWTKASTWFQEYVAEPMKKVFQGISDFVKGIFNGIIGFVEGVINRSISAANAFIGGFNKIVTGAAAFIGIEWDGIGEIPQITLPRLAEGGVATSPTLAEIGEGGEPEAVMPLSKLAALLDEYTKKPKPSGNPGGQEDGDGETIVFSPVFNFYGKADREEVEEATRISFQEFKRLYNKLKAEQRRKNFKPEPVTG